MGYKKRIGGKYGNMKYKEYDGNIKYRNNTLPIIWDMI